MKNRFPLMGQTAFGMFLMLSAFGMMASCSDDYDLDETMPSFLGGSIYDELKARGDFQNTIRLIDDLQYSDVLSKTGSKTLFVANDDAYKKFFAEQTVFKTNSGDFVRSYEQLSLAQKKRLLNNAMLNSAYVLEMMSNCVNGEKNLCLRQGGAASPVDSVAWWGKAELPQILSENADGTPNFPFGDYWTRRLQGDKAGLYMPDDAESPLITHFLEGQMREKSITHEDVSFLFNKKEGEPGYWANSDTENRSYVYDAQITTQDVVCMNGYVHVLDKVLVAPGNMADEIRSNGQTNLFSRILDRFSTPYYNAVLTENYNALAAVPADSVFERRYLAQRGPYGQITNIPGKDKLQVNGNFPFLSFDPAWTSFKSSDSEAKEKNMGAIFVPNDEALSRYFLEGGGRVLMDRYALKPNTRENLEYNLDQVPLDIIQALVNNLMKSSFNETVPSKYLTIMNDARDQMFPASDGYTSEQAYKDAFDKTIVANNGVVYIMNKVLSPADYASVIAPALYNANTQIVRSVVRADDNYIQGSTWSNAPLQKYFSTYLKAMQSRFSFFVPTDEGLGTYGYIDPATYVNRTGQMWWKWTYNDRKSDGGKRLPIDAVAYDYKLETGQTPNRKTNEFRSLYNDVLTSKYGQVKKNLLIEMVNQHIVVHPNNDTEGVRGEQKIYLSREGAPVIIKNNINGEVKQVAGGLQEQLTKEGKTFTSATPCNVTDVYDQSQETNGYGNGMTYLLDRPMQPTTVTTYKAINQVDGKLFKELCEGATKELLQQAGFRDELIAAGKGESDWNLVAQLYMVFLQGNAMGTAFNVPSGDKLVRFFNNYKYTVYVPSDAAIEAEIENGLPTWESIKDFLDANLIAEDQMPEKPEEESGPEWQAYQDAVKNNETVKQKAQVMVNTLVNFLKYHFQDESLFVDNVTANSHLMTAAVENDNYVNLDIAQTPGKMVLTDATGAKVSVDAEKCNIFARETHFDNATMPSMIESSSYVAVHQLAGDKALHYKKVGKWSDDWATVKKAKAFMAKYGTQK